MKMNNNMLIGLVVVLILAVLGWNFYSETVSSIPEAGTLATMEGYENLPNTIPQPVAQPTAVYEEKQEEDNTGAFTQVSSCYPKDQLSPEELLPQDYASTWAKCNPMGAGGLEGKNFLDAGHHIGINTVGQTLRNANLQLRSEPPNPQVIVSPFLNTSIEPDTNRRYFEVGSC